MLINKTLSARRPRIPASDVEIEDQLCTQIYTLNERGIVYSKGNDHCVDANGVKPASIPPLSLSNKLCATS